MNADVTTTDNEEQSEAFRCQRINAKCSIDFSKF